MISGFFLFFCFVDDEEHSCKHRRQGIVSFVLTFFLFEFHF